MRAWDESMRTKMWGWEILSGILFQTILNSFDQMISLGMGVWDESVGIMTWGKRVSENLIFFVYVVTIALRW